MSEDVVNFQKFQCSELKSFEEIFNLVGNPSKRTFGDLFQRAIMARFMSEILLRMNYFNDKEDQLLISSLILKLLQSASCNAYAIERFNKTSNESTEVGGAMYPTIALSNHSCWPNAIRYNVDEYCILRATRSIRKGQEVFDTYGPVYITDADRQGILSNQYKFVCDCKACDQNWSLYPHRDSITVLCPDRKCKQPAVFVKARKLQCNLCGEAKQFELLAKELASKLEKLYKTLKILNDPKSLKNLIEIQLFFDQHCEPPFQAYSDCQEGLKRCFNNFP